MEQVLKLELFNEYLSLEDIFEKDDPHNLSLPPIVPQVVEPGNTAASYVTLGLSVNEPSLNEIRENPAIEMGQAYNKSSANSALEEVAVTGASGQAISSNCFSPTSQMMVHSRSPSPVINIQDILRTPKRNKILGQTRREIPEKLKDVKYYEDHSKISQMSQRSREKKKRVDAERINLLRKNLEEIKLLKSKVEGYKQLQMRYFQLEREYAMLNQNLISLGGHIRQ
ncbi:unnamed protein product [Orchesella dallaii]|uniref:BZIP domain-containing protein n=1 Tax=Orchesella dallaii TaxID=48710 RepID=A0ABP1Q027_9HEXA